MFCHYTSATSQIINYTTNYQKLTLRMKDLWSVIKNSLNKQQDKDKSFLKWQFIAFIYSIAEVRLYLPRLILLWPRNSKFNLKRWRQRNMELLPWSRSNESLSLECCFHWESWLGNSFLVMKLHVSSVVQTKIQFYNFLSSQFWLAISKMT